METFSATFSDVRWANRLWQNSCCDHIRLRSHPTQRKERLHPANYRVVQAILYGCIAHDFRTLKGSIRTIVSRRGSEDKIAHRITRYLNDRDEAGDLLYVTHAGFLRTPHWHRADTWNLVVDEAMEVTYHREFRLRKYRHLLLDLFHVRPSRHERYGALEARNHGQLDEALVQMKDDEIYRHFADFIWRLRHDHWNLYVDHEAFQKFELRRDPHP